MKRIVIGLVAVAAIAVSGMFANQAEAGHPHHHHHHRHCRPPVVHHHCRPPVVHCYPSYGGYGSYRPVAPYGGGYYGGYQPYSGGFYVQQPRFGLSIGF